MKKIWVIIVSIVSSGCLAVPEEDSLNQVLHELNVIKQIIHEQKDKQLLDRRYVFSWNALEQDINIIKKGLADWVGKDLLEPRELEELSGDYVKDINK